MDGKTTSNDKENAAYGTEMAQFDTISATSSTTPKKGSTSEDVSNVARNGGFNTLRAPRTAKRKKRMLEALGETMGIIKHASTIAGISRRTHYIWLKEDPKYAQAVEIVEEEMLDTAEAAIIAELAGKDKLKAAMYYLDNKGKKRGYGQKPTTNVQVNTRESDESLKEWLSKAIKSGAEVPRQ